MDAGIGARLREKLGREKIVQADAVLFPAERPSRIKRYSAHRLYI